MLPEAVVGILEADHRQQAAPSEHILAPTFLHRTEQVYGLAGLIRDEDIVIAVLIHVYEAQTMLFVVLDPGPTRHAKRQLLPQLPRRRPLQDDLVLIPANQQLASAIAIEIPE